MRALDVLVHLAEPRHRRPRRLMHPMRGLALVQSGRSDPGDARPLDDDLPIGLPGSGVDIEKPSDRNTLSALRLPSATNVRSRRMVTSRAASSSAVSGRGET
jgi:hypothetical protein